jgi:hypothetical protein
MVISFSSASFKLLESYPSAFYFYKWSGSIFKVLKLEPAPCEFVIIDKGFMSYLGENNRHFFTPDI